MSHEGAFACNAPGCGQRFDNEGYLAIHQHKHEMTLKFTAPRSDSVIVSDQTPTPTRFLKNCEEVGLFNDLNSPYELDFKKEQDEEEKKHALDLRTALPGEGRPRGDEETRRSRPRGSPSHSAEIERVRPWRHPTPCTPFIQQWMSPFHTSEYERVRPRRDAHSHPTPCTPFIQQWMSPGHYLGLDLDSSSAATPLARPATLPLGRPGARPYFLTGHSPGMLVQQALPSPTSPSVITQAPSSHRHLAALPGPLPLFLHLPNGQTMPLGAVTSPTMPIPTALSMPLSTIPSPVGMIPSPVGMIPSPVGMIPSPVGMIPHIPGIPGPHMFSHGLPPPPPTQLPSPSESRMRLKQILAQQASSLHELHELHGLGLGGGGGGGCGGGARPVSRDSLPSPHERQLKEEGSSRRAESRPWESPYHEMNVKMESPIDDGGHGPPSFGGLTSASSDGGGGGGGGVRRRRSSVEDPEERRRRFLERNRAAATRCRLKRKAWVHSLERKAEDLADSNVQLQAEVTLLRSEVAHLKQLLLAHKDCPVTAMQIKQGYLRGSAPSEPAASAPLHGRSAPPPPAPPAPPRHRAPPSPDSDFNDGAASPVPAAAAAAAARPAAAAAAGASGGSSGQGSSLVIQQQQQQQHVIVGPPRAQPVSR